MAKKAVNEYIGIHPESLNSKETNVEITKPKLPNLDQKNLELDSNETADLDSSISFEKYELNNNDKEEKYLLAEETPATSAVLPADNEDLSIPKWVSYDSPSSQYS